MTIKLPFESALHDPHRLCANRIETMAEQWGETREELVREMADKATLRSVMKTALSILESKQSGRRSVATQEAIDALKYGVVRL